MYYKKRIEKIKKFGNDAKINKIYQRALKLYKEAIKLAEIKSLKAELAVLYSNCSAVYSEIKNYDEAIKSARKSIEYDSSYSKVLFDDSNIFILHFHL